MKKITTLVWILLLCNTGFSQEVMLVTYQDIINNVSGKNQTIKMSEQDVLAAKGEFNQTNATLLPIISVSHTALATTNPLMAFGSKLNQEILTQTDFNPTLLNAPSQIESYATRLEIFQPLINIDGIYQRKAAKAMFDASKSQFKRTTASIKLEVYKAYMQLQLAYKTVSVLELTKNSAMENKRIANNSYKQGLLQKTDILALEVRVTEIDNQLQFAKSQINNISNYVSVLINQNTDTILKPTDSLTITVSDFSEKAIPENRSDIQALQSKTKAYEQLYKADKMSFLPRLNAFGSYELYDDKIFQGSANGYIFGAELKWDVFEGSKRIGKVQKSKAEFEKSKIQLQQYQAESQVELNRANRMLQDIKNNLKLTSFALQQSRESLRIRSNRFKEGLEKTSDLLVAETQFAQKQLEYYTTIFNHNYALAYLKFLLQN